MTTQQLFYIKWSIFTIALCVGMYATLGMVGLIHFYDMELIAIFTWTATIVTLFLLSKVPQTGMVASVGGGILATIMTILSGGTLEAFGMIIVYTFVLGRIFYLFCLVTSGKWAKNIFQKRFWEYNPSWRLRDTMMFLALPVYILASLGIMILPFTFSYGMELSFGLLFVIPFFIILLSEYRKAFFPGIFAYGILLILIFLGDPHETELTIGLVGSPIAFLAGVVMYILCIDRYYPRGVREKK